MPFKILQENNVKAEILNLMGSIMLGKATKDEVHRVTKLAQDNGQFAFLKTELLSVTNQFK
ncbi:unnamed protein product [marine sediment metagenome]|uniref:Uncharacterized protein n=1 Tax=marine sediment metagenome TaxID=412755 RepID=X1S3M5_9ZZZZ